GGQVPRSAVEKWAAAMTTQAKPVGATAPRRVKASGGRSDGGRGILVSPYSAESERMAYAMVRSLRKYNRWLPVHVVSQDYVCELDWRGMATVRAVRAAGAHGTPEKWLNKLSGIRRSPFEETIFLDCDIVLLSDP